jgi:hypothetical protein
MNMHKHTVLWGLKANIGSDRLARRSQVDEVARKENYSNLFIYPSTYLISMCLQVTAD